MTDACPACATPYKARAAFCAACGQARPAAAPGSGLRPALSLYFALLAANLVSVIAVMHGGANVFTAMVTVTCVFAVLTAAFAITRWPDLAPLYRTAGFGLRGYALVTLAAPVVVAVVAGYLRGIERALGFRFPDELADLLPHGLAAVMLVVVIAPPLIEELAFRGVVFTSLSRSFGITESLVISSFAFAQLPQAPVSLVTHLPLGLYFCWLRHRSRSLWPSMYAHALHNLGVVLLSYH